MYLRGTDPARGVPAELPKGAYTMAMQTRTLGRKGPKVPVLGFGAWPIGGGLGKMDRSKAIETVRAAIDAGITLIDTAEGYRTSEQILGEALSGGWRERCFLATKASVDFSPAGIRRAAEQSLRSLRTDRIDLYQIHGWNPVYPVESSMEEMRRLQEEGKVLHLGVSNFLPEHMERAMKICAFASNQVCYSLLFRDIEGDGTIAFCERQGIGIVVHSPLAKGLLTRRYTATSTFPADDERAEFPDFKGERFAAHLTRAERIARIADARGITLVQLAIAWTLARLVVSCTLVGAKSPEQAREHVAAAGIVLSAGELAAIEAALI
jgi:aryl-alcohol dehydrogenase-like predicted oxidoreductase